MTDLGQRYCPSRRRGPFVGAARTRRNRLCGPWPALALMSLLWVVMVMPALAHATLQDTDPVSGAVLDRLPAAIGLRFSEPVSAMSMIWHLPDGTNVQAEAKSTPTGLSATPPPDRGAGSYTLAWRVVSADGHPVSGATQIAVGKPDGGAGHAVQTRHAGAVLATLLRLLTLSAMILSVGGGLYSLHVAPLPQRAAGIGRTAALLSLPLAVAALGAYGLELLGLPLSAVVTPMPWQAALAQPQGSGALLMTAAGLLAAVGNRSGKAAIWAAWAVGALSLALSGHAATGAWPLVGQSVVLAHAAAMIFWIGTLPPLLVSLRGPDPLAALRRFSALALPAVLVLVISGFALLLMRGSGLQALAASGWGRLLAVKLALVSLMLGLAIWNRRILTPALARAEPDAPTRLRRSIGAEILLGVAVLAVATCFRLTAPPAAGAPPYSGGYARLASAEATVDLDIRPMPPGAVVFAAYPGDATGEALSALALGLTVTDRLDHHDAVRIEMRPDGDGGWHSAPITLTGDAIWLVEADILIEGGRRLSVSGSLPR